jgi:hypothetical protein
MTRTSAQPSRRRLRPCRSTARRRSPNTKPRLGRYRFVLTNERPTPRLATVTHHETFSLLSTHAPLIEVSSDGPVFDLCHGLTVPDGGTVTARLDLRRDSVRRWRVDAPPSVRTAVVVTDSPYGAFVDVRRAVLPEPVTWRRYVSASAWPRLRAKLRRRAPSLLALWNLFTDEVRPAAWRAVGDGASHQAAACGGDLVSIVFVRP